MPRKIVFNERNHIFRRIGAYLLDTLLIFALVKLTSALLGRDSSVPDTLQRVRLDVANGVLFAGYSFLFQAFFMPGRTPGKRIMGLRVVSANGERAGKMQLLNREFVGKLFVEKCNLWITLLLVATGVMDGLLLLDNGTLRSVLYYLAVLPWPMFLSFAMVVNSPEHTSIHDRLAGTRVI